MPATEVEVPGLPAWLAPALPFRRRGLRIDDHLVHTIDHGNGPAVLLVHGNPTWSFLWRRVIRRLPNIRAVAPDLVGFGLSDKPRRSSWHGLDRHIEVVWRAVQALDLDRVVVVGQDWGGPIACGVGERLDAVGRLAGVVLGNTAVLAPRRPLRAKPFHRFSHFPGVSQVAFRGLGFPLQALPMVQGNPTSIGSFERRAYRWPLRRWSERAGPMGMARMVPHREGHPSLEACERIGAWVAQYRGPAALVWGLRDPLLGRALRRMRETWDHAHVVETQAGHFLQEEVPDELAQAILEVIG